MKKLLILLVILGLLGGGVAYYFYQRIFHPNVPDQLTNNILYIPSNATIQNIIDSLSIHNQIKHTESFLWVANKMSYGPDRVKSGRYKIEPGWSNRELINHLRLGKQEPVRLILNNIRTLDDLFDNLSKYVEPTADQFRKEYMNSRFLDSVQYDQNTLLTHFIPNTYEVYWNSSPRTLFARMESEKKAFWSKDNNVQKVNDQGLSETEAYILASIVEKESNSEAEKPKIAGVYLNRLKRGIRLQADPTVVFALGDFTIRRVLHRHLEYPSPYNTYLNDGLPPGPICMPSLNSLLGVINAQDHNYLYFCVDPNGNGEHVFAETLAEHNRNARKFHQWLNQKGIR